MRLNGINRATLAAAADNSRWLLADKVIRVFTGLLLGVWMARELGPNAYGQLNYALSLVAIVTPIATLGVDSIVVRDLVRFPDAAPRLLGTTAILKGVASVVAAALLVGIARLLQSDDDTTRALCLIVALGLIPLPVDVIDLWFQSKVRSKHVVIARMPALVIFFCARCLLLWSGASLANYAWAHVLELVVAAVGIWIAYRLSGQSIRLWRFDPGQMKTMVHEAWPLLIAAISVMVYMRIDMVMIEGLSDIRQTGIYGAATRLSEGVYFLPMIITSSLAPLLIQKRTEDREKYEDMLFELYKLMIRISVGFGVLIALSSSWLVNALFGPEYSEAAAVLCVHVWSCVAVSLGVASSQYLTNERFQRLSLFRTASGLIVNVLLNVLWIPEHGALGAAYATLVSYFVATFALAVSQTARGQVYLMIKAMHPAVVIGWKDGRS